MEYNPNNQLNRGRCRNSYIQHPPAPENNSQNPEFELPEEKDHHATTFPQNNMVHEVPAKQKAG